MKTLRLTAPARATLQEIIKYTIEVFGVQQAERYQQQLIATAERLCNSQFPLGRDCSLLLDEDSGTSKLLYVREGMHYLIYTETSEHIVLHDFIHVNRNLPALLNAIKRR